MATVYQYRCYVCHQNLETLRDYNIHCFSDFHNYRIKNLGCRYCEVCHLIDNKNSRTHFKDPQHKWMLAVKAAFGDDEVDGIYKEYENEVLHMDKIPKEFFGSLLIGQEYACPVFPKHMVYKSTILQHSTNEDLTNPATLVNLKEEESHLSSSSPYNQWICLLCDTGYYQQNQTMSTLQIVEHMSSKDHYVAFLSRKEREIFEELSKILIENAKISPDGIARLSNKSKSILYERYLNGQYTRLGMDLPLPNGTDESSNGIDVGSSSLYWMGKLPRVFITATSVRTEKTTKTPHNETATAGNQSIVFHIINNVYTKYQEIRKAVRKSERISSPQKMNFKKTSEKLKDRITRLGLSIDNFTKDFEESPAFADINTLKSYELKTLASNHESLTALIHELRESFHPEKLITNVTTIAVPCVAVVGIQTKDTTTSSNSVYSSSEDKGGLLPPAITERNLSVTSSNASSVVAPALKISKGNTAAANTTTMGSSLLQKYMKFEIMKKKKAEKVPLLPLWTTKIKKENHQQSMPPTPTISSVEKNLSSPNDSLSPSRAPLKNKTAAAVVETGNHMGQTAEGRIVKQRKETQESGRKESLTHHDLVRGDDTAREVGAFRNRRRRGPRSLRRSRKRLKLQQQLSDDDVREAHLNDHNYAPSNSSRGGSISSPFPPYYNCNGGGNGNDSRNNNDLLNAFFKSMLAKFCFAAQQQQLKQLTIATFNNAFTQFCNNAYNNSRRNEFGNITAAQIETFNNAFTQFCSNTNNNSWKNAEFGKNVTVTAAQIETFNDAFTQFYTNAYNNSGSNEGVTATPSNISTTRVDENEMDQRKTNDFKGGEYSPNYSVESPSSLTFSGPTNRCFSSNSSSSSRSSTPPSRKRHETHHEDESQRNAVTTTITTISTRYGNGNDTRNIVIKDRGRTAVATAGSAGGPSITSLTTKNEPPKCRDKYEIREEDFVYDDHAVSDVKHNYLPPRGEEEGAIVASQGNYDYYQNLPPDYALLDADEDAWNDGYNGISQTGTAGKTLAPTALPSFASSSSSFSENHLPFGTNNNNPSNLFQSPSSAFSQPLPHSYYPHQLHIPTYGGNNLTNNFNSNINNLTPLGAAQNFYRQQRLSQMFRSSGNNNNNNNYNLPLNNNNYNNNAFNYYNNQQKQALFNSAAAAVPKYNYASNPTPLSLMYQALQNRFNNNR